MTLFNQMIREPHTLANECVRGESLERVVKGSLVAIVVGTALFGAILGATRGGLQVVYSAVKLPIAILATLVVATPAFHAFAALAGKPMPLRAGSALVLASLARASLALLALSPLLWLVVDIGVGYHASIEMAVLLYTVAGLAAVSVIVHGLEGARFRTLATAGFLAVFLPVFAQTAWVLRPYSGRPSAETVPFLREPEGSFMDAVATTALSSMGVYEGNRTAARAEYDEYSSRTSRGYEASVPATLPPAEASAVRVDAAMDVDADVTAAADGAMPMTTGAEAVTP